MKVLTIHNSVRITSFCWDTTRCQTPNLQYNTILSIASLLFLTLCQCKLPPSPPLNDIFWQFQRYHQIPTVSPPVISRWWPSIILHIPGDSRDVYCKTDIISSVVTLNDDPVILTSHIEVDDPFRERLRHLARQILVRGKYHELEDAEDISW